MEIKLSEYGTILGLRKTAKRIRVDVITVIENGETVKLNFNGVKSVSSCFADELVGKLWYTYSNNTAKSRLFSIYGVESEDIKNVLVKAIVDRITNGDVL